MPTNRELQVEQRRRLFMLLKLKKDNGNNKIIGLNDMIIATEAEMEEEDVALVEKKIAQLMDE
jgi:hypothetical protein